MWRPASWSCPWSTFWGAWGKRWESAKTLSIALREYRVELLVSATAQILKSYTMAEVAVFSMAFPSRALRPKLAVADIVLSFSAHAERDWLSRKYTLRLMVDKRPRLPGTDTHIPWLHVYYDLHFASLKSKLTEGSRNQSYKRQSTSFASQRLWKLQREHWDWNRQQHLFNQQMLRLKFTNLLHWWASSTALCKPRPMNPAFKNT